MTEAIDKWIIGGLSFLMVIALILAGFLFWGLCSERARADELKAEIEAPNTGYRDRLAGCRATAQNLEGRLDYQSDQVDAWKAEAERIRTEGEARLAGEREKVKAAERRLIGARRAVAREGETQCEAADRTIVERLG